jgi:hypothetical protein
MYWGSVQNGVRTLLERKTTAGMSPRTVHHPVVCLVPSLIFSHLFRFTPKYERKAESQLSYLEML